MPNYDGTGPKGQGAKTGAQQGECDGAKFQDRPFEGKGKGARRRAVCRGRSND